MAHLEQSEGMVIASVYNVKAKHDTLRTTFTKNSPDFFFFYLFFFILIINNQICKSTLH